ncbi:unknown [Prevotella sp. CAG:1185]|nr:unknown [Prevotella sp. CAG:1185]
MPHEHRLFFQKIRQKNVYFSNDQLGINTSKITYKHVINNIRLCLNHTRFIALIVFTPPYSHNLSIYCYKIHH